MTGYVVSKGGTFGVVHRVYRDGSGGRCVVIRWGPLGWVTPVPESECKYLRSFFESEARAEAEEWVNAIEDVRDNE